MFRRHPKEDNLACSFCHKSEDTVGKLISSPSDYPRAYICDECIAVCASIIIDPPDNSLIAASHPLASQFFSLVEDWISREDRGEDVSEVLDEMLSLARRIVGPTRKNEPIG